MDVPETRFAKAPDGAFIAYQVRGQGPPDLVYVPESTTDTQIAWEQPLDAKFLNALAAFTRVILIDRRGTGRSDPAHDTISGSFEAQMGDVLSVLDAIGSHSAALFGVFESGPLCELFAATHPERISALVLYATYARGAWAPDYPWAWTDEEFEDDMARIEAVVESGHPEEYFQHWIQEYVPSLAGDSAAQPWLRKAFRVSHAPGALLTRLRIDHEVDARAVLPSIRIPTIVINRRRDRIAELEEGRWIAGQIETATFVELDGVDHPPWAGDQRPILDAISRFLGVKHTPVELDSVLATVLFTDIVESTAKQAALGNQAWKELVERHHTLVREEIERWHGTEVDTAGDGFYATFDGPVRAVRCALDVRERVSELGLDVRAGVHVGECTIINGKPGGLPVTIGARIASHAGASEIFVSQTVKDLVPGSGLVFEDAGEHELKGVPDHWHLYRVVS